MLRRRDNAKTYKTTITVAGADAVFELKAMSLDDTRHLLDEVVNMQAGDGDSMGRILDLVARPIVSIDGIEDETPRQILGDLEFMEDVNEIITGLIEFSTLSREDAENLSLSPGLAILVAVGSAERNASGDQTGGPEDAPASTTPTKTEA